MDSRLARALERARTSEFYRRHLAAVKDWAQTPLTTKADLRAGYPFAFVASPRPRLASYHESSGTDGAPIASLFTEGDWQDIASRFLRGAVNLGEKDHFFIKTPYSMVTTAHQAQRAGQLAGALVVPADNRSTNMPYSRVVQLLRDLAVTVSWSLPTEPLLWAVAARAQGWDPQRDFPALRALWVAGEPLSPSRRRAMERIWGGVKVVEDYGSTETGSLGGELSCGQLHLWGDRLYFEVLAEDGTLREQGRGRLVVTPYYRQAMPLIRYLLDDEVEILAGKCSCGSENPVARLFGRGGQAIRVGGRELFPLEIEEAVYAAGEAAELALWQGDYDDKGLEIRFHALGDGSEAGFARSVSDRLGLPVTAVAVAASGLLDPRLLTEPLRFSKPKFLYPKRAVDARTLLYA